MINSRRVNVTMSESHNYVMGVIESPHWSISVMGKSGSAESADQCTRVPSVISEPANFLLHVASSRLCAFT